ncbi:MAG: hypothetical protein JWN44_1476 [Myxococcales bacterium]|nr:hypothetical protein [Myxococcales bacterium]
MEATERTEATGGPEEIEVPAPTAWPLTMAFGATLLGAGLVTAGEVSLLGAVLLVAGAVGWFRVVLPVERSVRIPIEPEGQPRIEPRPPTTHPRIAEREHRARLPVEIFPVSAGIKGGIAGGVVMALTAAIYGVISHHGVWYPINILVAGFYRPELRATTEELSAFDGWALLFGTLIHGVTSLLVGTLYGMLLPMFSRRPVLAGGLVAPLAWSALLYPTIGMINPVLARRIDWGWFLVSQIGFGLAAGVVVSRSLRIHTRQSEPFAERIGLETGRRP